MKLFKGMTVFTMIVAFCLFSCGGGGSGGDGPLPIIQDGNVDEYIQSLSEIDQPEKSPYEIDEVEEGISMEKEDVEYVCSSTTYSGFPEFGKFMLSKTNVDVLYPGALLEGQSIVDKTYVPSSIKPGPLTLTVNLQSLGGNEISKTIENPSYSTVQTAIHEILGQEIIGDPGAEMSWVVQKVYSKAHLQASLELDVDVAEVFSVGGDAGLGFSASSNCATIQYNQKYFDIIIDVPLSPDEYIDPELDYETIKNTFYDISPVYVSSVSYGRMVLFYFESTDLSLDLKAALNGAIKLPVNGVPIKGDASAKIEAGFSEGSLTCKAFILGGSGEAASQSITDLDALLSFIQTGGRYSKESPGKPISYTLRYLSNNNPVKIVNFTEYDETKCSKAYNNYRIKMVSFEMDELAYFFLRETVDLYGTISVTVSDMGSVDGDGILWSMRRAEDSYPITNNIVKPLSGEADVSFPELTSVDRTNQYIQLNTNISTEYAWIGWEALKPNFHRFYLDDLPEGEDSVYIQAQYKGLDIKFEIEGLD
jgi:thiol-activated cytolysin